MQRCADNPTWGHIPQLFATFEPWRRHLRRITNAKDSQKSQIWGLDACIWLARTNRQNWVPYFQCENDKLVQSYAARLFRNTFLNFVSNFSLEEGNWLICLWQHHIFKMGYFKCTILFNICTISFLSYYYIGCTMFR